MNLIGKILLKEVVMGLQCTLKNKREAYIRLTGIDANFDTRRLHIRFAAYPDRQTRDDPFMKDSAVKFELNISEKFLIERSKETAKAKVDIRDIVKQHESAYIKGELSKTQKDKICMSTFQCRVSREATLMGKKKLLSILEDFQKKDVYYVSYELLKEYGDFSTVKDQK